MNIRRLAFLTTAIFTLSFAAPVRAVVDQVTLPEDSNSSSKDYSLPDLSGNSRPSVTPQGSLYAPINPNDAPAPSSMAAPFETPAQTPIPQPATAEPPAMTQALPLNVNNAIRAKMQVTPRAPVTGPLPPTVQLGTGTPTFESSSPGIFRLKLPTSVIQDHPQVNNDQTTGSQSTQSVTFEFAETTWSDDDIQSVVKHLGIDKSRVTSDCIITALGNLTTDKSPRSINFGSNTQVTVGYEGTLRRAMVNIEALCKVDNLGPDLGFIHEMNGRYIAPLTMANCTPGSTPTQKFTISRVGGVLGKCTAVNN